MVGRHGGVAWGVLETASPLAFQQLQFLLQLAERAGQGFADAGGAEVEELERDLAGFAALPFGQLVAGAWDDEGQILLLEVLGADDAVELVVEAVEHIVPAVGGEHGANAALPASEERGGK